MPRKGSVGRDADDGDGVVLALGGVDDAVGGGQAVVEAPRFLLRGGELALPVGKFEVGDALAVGDADRPQRLAVALVGADRILRIGGGDEVDREAALDEIVGRAG